ncbi:unnamed protein product [Moneuplotes crassus]|uniref:Uncharacterized protein n=1 Tax=Euplotes crassus TaxID=5936 RepID=A0AAD1TZX5_EUPCR|nr:unnamed protein product [Moneuplotes crassus]
MNKLIHFEENLSEELLDEDVSVSRLNMSPNIEKNMVGSPFHFGHNFMKLGDKESCPEPNSACKSPSCASSTLEVPSNDFSCSKSKKNDRAQRASLKEDIKDLLHQAIRLRSLPNCSKKEKCEEVPALRRFNGEITMRDIEAS